MGVEQEALRNDLHELVLDLARRLAGRDAEAVCDAKHMRVDRERRLAEGGVEHDIGGLAADPRQSLERGAVLWRLPAMLLDDRARQRDDVPRL